MSFFVRQASRRVTQMASRQQQVTFRRSMSGGGDHSIPGHNVLREFAYGIGLGLAFGLVWKQWQWNDKARRIMANNKWEKQYPAWQAERRAAVEAEEAEATSEEEEVTEQPANEDRPESADAHNNPDTQQPLPTEKKEPGKVIPSKKNQNDL